ncbi:hypothetical protein JOD14_001855 [Enterococcus lemanii]|nr:hypothetical protein [Enterococcus lemanii]
MIYDREPANDSRIPLKLNRLRSGSSRKASDKKSHQRKGGF